MKTNGPQLTLSLIRRAQRGRPESLSRLSRAVEGRIHRYIYRMTLDYHLTDDLCQDTLLEMVRHLPELKIDRPSALWAWLHKTALSKVRGHLRKTRHAKVRQSIDSLDEASLADRLTEPGVSAPDRLIHQEVTHAVVRAMESLRLNYRSVLALRCFDDLSYAQIAQVMGGTQVRARLLFFRAKKSLRHELARNGLGRMHLVSGLTVFGAVTAGTGRSASATVLIGEGAMETGLGVAVLGTALSKVGLTAAVAVVATALAVGSLSSSPKPSAPPLPETSPPSGEERFDAFAYPLRVSDSNDPDGDGWSAIGLGEPNLVSQPIDPPQVLVGEPSGEEVALILPANHWVELQFPGVLHDGTGPDLLVVGADVESMADVLVISEATEPVSLTAGQFAPHPSGLTMATYDFASLPELVRPLAVRIRGIGAADPNSAFRLLRVRARTEPSEPADLGT